VARLASTCKSRCVLSPEGARKPPGCGVFLGRFGRYKGEVAPGVGGGKPTTTCAHVARSGATRPWGHTRGTQGPEVATWLGFPGHVGLAIHGENGATSPV
jgi:hypothetical protein